MFYKLLPSQQKRRGEQTDVRSAPFALPSGTNNARPGNSNEHAKPRIHDGGGGYRGCLEAIGSCSVGMS